MSKRYIIRPATMEDEETILKLSRFVADNYTRSYLGDEIVDRYIDSGNCDADMRKGIKNSTLLLLDEKIIGIMIWHENQMLGFMVDICCHGTGAAQYFCNQIIPEKLKRYHALHLECFDKNHRGIAFYKKTGWTEYGQIEDEVVNGHRILFKLTKWAPPCVY